VDTPSADQHLSSAIEEVRQGDWIIANLVLLRNTTLVMDGNITVAAGGHLRLENATLVMNSTYELQYSIEVLSGGAFSAVDLDGDSATRSDASNVTAGQRGNTDPLSQDDFFHYGFIVRDGALLVLLDSEIREIGSYIALTSEHAGLYLENDNVRIEGNRFTGNLVAMILHGNVTITVENMVLAGNTFEGNGAAIAGGGKNLTIERNLFNGDDISTLTAEDMMFASNSLLGPPGIAIGASMRCINNCTMDGNYWRNWSGSLSLSDSTNVLLRNETYISDFPNTAGLRIDRSSSVTIEGMRSYGGRAGLRLFVTEVEVRDSVLDGGFEGFWADLRSQTLIVNSTISNAIRYSVLLDRDSHLTTRNTTFDKSTAQFWDPLSTLTTEWFLHVRAQDAGGAPLPGAGVIVQNASGGIVGTGMTASDGRFPWSVAREYVQSDLTGDGDGTGANETVYDTPHNVTATFQGMTAYAVPEPFVNETKEVVVRFPASLEAVTVTRSPEAGRVRVDGTWYDVPATFSWLSGTTHTIEAPPIDEYAASSRYAFAGWSDGGALAHSVTTPLGGGTFVASYRTQHRPVVTLLGTDGHSVRFDYVANGSAAAGFAAGTWSEWVDEGSAVVPSAIAEGSTAVERWATDASFTGAPWTPVTAPFGEAVTYGHQFRVQVTIVGLPATSPATLAFVRLGTAGSATGNASFDLWSDAGTVASMEAEVAVGARERYRTADSVSWTVDAPVDATVRYRRQFLHNVVLNGTDAQHMVEVAFTLDGVFDSDTAYGTWTNWSDAGTTLSVAAETTGEPPRRTDDPTSWTASAPLDVVVRYREAAPPPPPREANLKPLLALAFSLAVVAAALVRRRRGAGRDALLLHLPFVVLEVGIGVASWAWGVLSVPPWVGPGTLVNGAILVAGLLLPGWRRINRLHPSEADSADRAS